MVNDVSSENWKLVKLSNIEVNKRVLNGVHKVHRDGILLGAALLGALVGMFVSVLLFAFDALTSVESILVVCVILAGSLLFLGSGMFIMNQLAAQRKKYMERLAHELVKTLADEGWITTFESAYTALRNKQGGRFSETDGTVNYTVSSVTITDENHVELLFALDDKEAVRTARSVKAKNQAVTALELWKAEHPDLKNVTVDEAFMAGVTWREG